MRGHCVACHFQIRVPYPTARKSSEGWRLSNANAFGGSREGTIISGSEAFKKDSLRGRKPRDGYGRAEDLEGHEWAFAQEIKTKR